MSMSRQRSWTRTLFSNPGGTGGSVSGHPKWPALAATMPQIRAPRSASSDGLEPLLAEQLAYYRAVAPTYGETAVPEVGETTLKAAAAPATAY
jgi:hypothetical protein